VRASTACLAEAVENSPGEGGFHVEHFYANLHTNCRGCADALQLQSLYWPDHEPGTRCHPVRVRFGLRFLLPGNTICSAHTSATGAATAAGCF